MTLKYATKLLFKKLSSKQLAMIISTPTPPLSHSNYVNISVYFYPSFLLLYAIINFSLNIPLMHNFFQFFHLMIKIEWLKRKLVKNINK